MILISYFEVEKTSKLNFRIRFGFITFLSKNLNMIFVFYKVFYLLYWFGYTAEKTRQTRQIRNVHRETAAIFVASHFQISMFLYATKMAAKTIRSSD